MAEVLVEYDAEFSSAAGERYTARACGRAREDGLWEGWLEFVPLGGGPAIRTGRETTQPDRQDLLYWATGLTAHYLDGALMRITAPPREVGVRTVSDRPAFDGPAEPTRSPRTGSGSNTAILDPFAVHAEGADVLRRQLHALSPDQLRNIVRVYGLSTISTPDLDRLDETSLVSLITGEVARRS